MKLISITSRLLINPRNIRSAVAAALAAAAVYGMWSTATTDYRAYAERTNASALWGWAVTRIFEWSSPSPDVVWNSVALKKLIQQAPLPRHLDAEHIPMRRGLRPTMVRGIPHRQLDQHPTPQAKVALEARLASMKDFPSAPSLRFRPSLWELTGASALIIEGCSKNSCPEELYRSKGEFAHLHSYDGSAHMVLAPADIATIIEKGWGELFPVANGLGGLVPWIALVYAPRNAQEEEVFIRILIASHAFSTTLRKGQSQ